MLSLGGSDRAACGYCLRNPQNERDRVSSFAAAGVGFGVSTSCTGSAGATAAA